MAKKAVMRSDNFDKVKDIMGAVNKKMGVNALKLGTDIKAVHKVPFMEPTLDYVYDGGIPISRITEMLGDEHSGKTRNSIKAMAQFQKFCFGCFTAGTLSVEWDNSSGTPVAKKCSCSNCAEPRTVVNVFVDLEGTASKEWLEQLGVDTAGIVYAQPDLPSKAVDLVDIFLRMPDIGLIIIDSVGGMGSDAEMEKEMADIKMNKNAMFLNTAMRKWQNALNVNANEDPNSPTSMIIINQSYSSIGQFVYEIAQGGRGLRHGKGMSVKTKIVEKVKNEKGRGDVVGVHIRATNEKNKTGFPYRKMEYYMSLEDGSPEGYCGIDYPLQLVEVGIKLGIIEQRGAWFYIGELSFQGREKLAAAIGNDEVTREDLQKSIYETFRRQKTKGASS